MLHYINADPDPDQGGGGGCLSVSNQCCGFGMFIPDLGS